jgi:hypothetical protein
VTRHASAEEIRLTLARFARQAPDDVAGYLIVLAKEDGTVLCTVSNASDQATVLGILGVTIMHSAASVKELEDQARGTMNA